MKTQDKIQERVQVGLRISEPDYFIGLVYLLNCLYEDYFKYIEDEERMRGIMLRYQEEVNKAFLDYFGEWMTEERYDFCGRVVFLYRNIVYNEFRFMNKRLSPADRVIVIIKRIFEFLDEIGEENDDPSLKTIKEISESLYDNIRWKQKNTDLHRFIRQLKKYYNEGLIGKQPLFKYSIRDEQDRYQKRYQEFKESEVLVDEAQEIQIEL